MINLNKLHKEQILTCLTVLKCGMTNLQFTWDPLAVVHDLLNVQLAPGYGPTRDRAFRIAAMGHTAEETMSRVLEGLSLILLNWAEIKPL